MNLKLKSVAFGNIGAINLVKKAANRAAEVLPSEEDLRKIISKCNEALKKLEGKKQVSPAIFIEICRAVFCRLLFLNGRRPSEISNLEMGQWELCKNNYYLTEQQKKTLTNEGVSLSYLENNFRVIITIIKSRDVPVVIPRCLFKAMDFLQDQEIRDVCNANTSTMHFMTA